MLETAEADPNFPEFDRQQVIDEMKQYLWAGTETTALTLAWSLYLLSMHPEALERIRGRGAHRVAASAIREWNEVQQLSYTRMVIQETMRLFPPIWALIRIAAGDDEIEGHKIKAGDKVVILTYIAHHSPKYWDDPEKFDPERFAPERSKKRVKYSLPALRRRQTRLHRRRAVAGREHAGARAAASPLHAGICRPGAGEDPRHRDPLPQRRPSLPHPRIELAALARQQRIVRVIASLTSA